MEAQEARSLGMVVVTAVVSSATVSAVAALVATLEMAVRRRVVTVMALRAPEAAEAAEDKEYSSAMAKAVREEVWVFSV